LETHYFVAANEDLFEIFTATCHVLANRYGLEDPEIKVQWGARFFLFIHNGTGALSASYKMAPDLFPEGGRGS
jgi:hypothetical protein